MTPPSSCHTKQNVALPKWYGNNSESISWHDNTHHLQQNNFHNIHHDNYSDSSKKSSGASSTYYSTAFRLVDGTKHPASSLHDLEEIDNAYNITADCLFFIGSVCVLVTASWNFSFSSTSIAATDADKAMFWISVLAVLGPLIYLCNAFVEIAVAIRPIRRASGEYHHQYLPLLTTATSIYFSLLVLSQWINCGFRLPAFLLLYVTDLSITNWNWGYFVFNRVYHWFNPQLSCTKWGRYLQIFILIFHPLVSQLRIVPSSWCDSALLQHKKK